MEMYLHSQKIIVILSVSCYIYVTCVKAEVQHPLITVQIDVNIEAFSRTIRRGDTWQR